MGKLYSIGYGARNWAQVLDLLKQRGCQFLIDVRTSPYSKFHAEFNREVLMELCAKARIKYVFMGDTLGGKPADPGCFDTDGRVDYVALAESPSFQFGISRLQTASSKDVVSFLMCSESKPETCHRSKLIGAELAEKSIAITHVDEGGVDISQEQAIARLTKGQDDMFGNPLLDRSRGKYGGGL